VLNMNSIAINAASDNAEEAWKFIVFLATEEEQTRRAAEGLAVARRSSALEFLQLSTPPYDLTPFMFGPTINRGSMTMPNGAAWPAEVDRITRQIIEGLVDPIIGITQAADALRRELRR